MEQTNTNGRVVNIDYLTQLSRGNTRFVDEMINIFLTETPREIHVLEMAVDNCDYDLIKAAAHKLRSTLPYIGLDQIVEHEVSEMENLALTKTGIEEIQGCLAKIKNICEQAYRELQPAR